MSFAKHLSHSLGRKRARLDCRKRVGRDRLHRPDMLAHGGGIYLSVRFSRGRP